MSGLNKLRDEIHKNAIKHGWWNKERSFGEIIALCHSELSEALEEFRKRRKPAEIYYTDSQGVPYKEDNGRRKPEGIPIELADCIIRILDYCGREGINIEEAIRLKHEHNKSRPYRHGGKTI